jgi:hypothetical protein
MSLQPFPLIEVVSTPAYGMHRATVRTPDGRQVSALGQTPQQAEQLARHEARKGND